MMSFTQRPQRALAAAGLSLALVATSCGSDSTASSAGPLAPVPVHVAGSGSGVGNGFGSDGAATAESTRVADSSMLAPWVVVDYVLGDALPAMPGEANGWQYPSGATPDSAMVEQIAGALGVAGDLLAISDAEGGGWRVGPGDGTAPSLHVAADGQLNWWYSPSWADGQGRGLVAVSSGCAIPVDGEPDDVDAPAAIDDSTRGDEDPSFEACVYEEPTPPAGILSDAEAEARALELLAAIGVDEVDVELETWADAWAASVTAYVRLGGTRSPVSYSFGFGENGQLDWANGVLASPAEVGPYSLVSIQAAVARLREGYGGWGGPFPAIAETDVAFAEVSPAVDLLACDAETDECVLPEPEEITVMLTDVYLDLWWVWDIDGSVWLLPAYTFEGGPGGGQYSVPAVADEYLVYDDGGAVGDDGESEVLPPVDRGEPTEGGVGEVFPDEEVEVSQEQADTLIGLTEDEALAAAQSAGWTVRVVARDGESFSGTTDFVTSRVNLALTDGVVESVTVG